MSLEQDFVERMQVLAQSTDFSTLIDVLISKYQEDWRTSPPERADRREEIYRMIAACDALRKEVQNIALGDAVTAHNQSLKLRNNSW